MKLVKLNSVVSMYEKPVLGSVSGKNLVMALTIDKSTLNKKIKLGIAREIVNRKGSVDVFKFVDKSKLIIVKSKSLLKWYKVKDLKIQGMKKIIKELTKKDTFFIGLEDPDIWVDKKGLKHVFFTIAFKYKNKLDYDIYLGHAKGESFDNLEATTPVLFPIKKKKIRGFKELAIPLVKNNKIILTEMGLVSKNKWISVIASVKTNNKKSWQYIKNVLDPRKIRHSWCNRHVSPCCFLPIKVNGLLVGIINGRGKSKVVHGKEIFGKFCPGLIFLALLHILNKK